MAGKNITEAQALREYLRVKAREQMLSISALREEIEKSNLTMSEARPFYAVVERMEKERIKI